MEDFCNEITTSRQNPKYDEFYEMVDNNPTKVPEEKPLLNVIHDDLMAIQNPVHQLMQYAKEIPSAYQTLKNNKDLMDKLGYDGSDNYFHRKGMCEATQNGLVAAGTALAGGVAKEGRDILKKAFVDEKPILETLQDSAKDMGNNLEGLTYGLLNPLKDCKDWLDELDWYKNKWKLRRYKIR